MPVSDETWDTRDAAVMAAIGNAATAYMERRLAHQLPLPPEQAAALWVAFFNACITYQPEDVPLSEQYCPPCDAYYPKNTEDCGECGEPLM